MSNSSPPPPPQATSLPKSPLSLISAITNITNMNNNNNNDTNVENINLYNELVKKMSTLNDPSEIEHVLKRLMEAKLAAKSNHSQASDSQCSRATKASGDTNQLFGSSTVGGMLNITNNINNTTNNNNTIDKSKSNIGLGRESAVITTSSTSNALHERSISDALSIVSQQIGIIQTFKYWA